MCYNVILSLHINVINIFVNFISCLDFTVDSTCVYIYIFNVCFMYSSQNV